ncbi:hypothetical protein VYU27_003870 [Nannochloropsis oceanica]
MSSASSASSEYIRTTTNYISRKALIEGPQYVEMRGRSIVEEDVTIRGDLAPIRVGHYCFFAAGSVLSPCFIIAPPQYEPQQQQQQPPQPPQPPQQQQSKQRYIPMTIGSMTNIGPDAVIQAASIGSHVEIGANCIVSPRCILKDCCRLAPGTVLPPDSVVPPFALMSGAPAKMVGELPPSVVSTMKEKAQGRYRRRKRWIVGEGGSGSSSSKR